MACRTSYLHPQNESLQADTDVVRVAVPVDVVGEVARVQRMAKVAVCRHERQCRDGEERHRSESEKGCPRGRAAARAAEEWHEQICNELEEGAEQVVHVDRLIVTGVTGQSDAIVHARGAKPSQTEPNRESNRGQSQS